MSYFSDLAANRRWRVVEAMRFGVYGFTKDGARRATPSVRTRTEAEADRRAADMTQLNAGARFIVAPLGSET